MTGFRQRAFAAMVAAVAAASPLSAAGQAQYTVVGAVANQSVSINNHSDGNASNSSSGLGTTTASAGDASGSATTAGGNGSASASLRQGTTPGGGLGFPGLGGTASGNANATVTYQYIFTAKTPGQVVSLINNPPPSIQAVGCAQYPNLPPCTIPVQTTPPTYFIPNATKITGNYQTDSTGYGYGSVAASGFGPDSLSSFSTECGYSRSGGTNCDGRSSSGSFSIFGALLVDNASLAANSFYGFIKLSAGARLLEGGSASAFIDPIVSLNLDGLDPNDFTLTLSPGFTTDATATPSVPEPASWALMIVGFGAVGLAARRRAGGLMAARAA